MKLHRQQYLDWMTFQGGLDRPIFSELFGPLIGLDAEWRSQGASEAEIAMTAFDWDYVPYRGCGGHTGVRGLPVVTLSEDDDLLVQRDHLGRTVQLCKKTATIALPSDFPVQSMDDWLKIKPMYQYDDARVDWADVERAKDDQAKGVLVVAGIPGAFDTVRELMGEENGCLAYYEQPELIADILQTVGDTAERVLKQIAPRLKVDQLSVHEDFAGRSGPLVGPTQIEQTFKPYYLRIWNLLREHGTRLFIQDTDGNVNPVIDALLDAGLNGIYPMEPAAGMDIVALRKQYGQRLIMRGGIDKHVLRQDKAAIRRELEYKLQPGFWTGGIVLGLDHRIPNGTLIDNYRYYVQTARDMLGLPPLSPGRSGWGRMAF